MITMHYVVGTATGFSWYKIAEASWLRVRGQWYDWRMIADGTSLQLFVDDTLTLSATDSHIPEGYIGLVSFANHNAYFDDIYVWRTVSS